MRSRILAFVFLLVLFLSVIPAWSQTYVLFNTPHQQFLDTSGRPLAGGRIYTYAAGTTTPQVTYQDTVGTPNTNPIVLDSGGFGTIYLSTNLSYKVVMKNSQNVQQWSVDNIAGTTGTISTVPLNSILPATGTNSIDNGNNIQRWNWQLTGTSAATAFRFSETAASTNSGVTPSLVDVATVAGSTLWPFRAYNGSGNGFGVTPTGNVQTLGTGTFIGPLTGNVTGNVSGTAGSLAGTPTQCTTVTQYATGIAPNGNANCNPFTAVFAAAPPITGTTATFTGAVSTGSLTSTTGTFSGAVNAASVTSAGNIHGGTLQADNLALAPTYLLNDATGKIVPCPAPCAVPTGGPAPALSALTNALANNTLANSSFTQTWNWVLTGATNGMVFGEASAGAGTGAVVQINGLSNAVTPLDVEAPLNVNQIHFGNSPTTGAWLMGAGGNAVLSGGQQYVLGSGFTARSTAAASLTLNQSNAGIIAFTGDTGKTIGNTFTPTTLETIAPLAGGNTAHTFYAGGSAYSTINSAPSYFQFVNGATFDGTNYIAKATSASIISASLQQVQFYANTGLTIGNAITSPTLIANFNLSGFSAVPAITTGGNTTTGSLNVTTNSTVTGTETVGRLVTNGGVSQGSGIKHQRAATCTTTAVANGSCAGTFTWTAGFADGSYTVSCTLAVLTNPAVVWITGVSAASFNYTLFNVGAGAAASGTLECIAMHD